MEQLLRKKLNREISEFQKSVKASSESILKYKNELQDKCHRKCVEIWRNYENIVEQARQDASDLIGEMERRMEEEIERCRRILYESKRILQEIERCHRNLEHLFIREDHHEGDILHGLKQLDAKLSMGHHKWMRPRKEYEFSFSLPNWWQKAVQQQPLLNRDIGSVFCTRKTFPAEKAIEGSWWNLPESKSISSIIVSENDQHVFIIDYENQSLTEIDEDGKIVFEFSFTDKGNGQFKPLDICLISAYTLVVCGEGEKKMFLFKRVKISPFLELKKIIETEKCFSSLCSTNETIFACELSDFKIHSFTKEGDKMKTFTIVGPKRGIRFLSRIRVEPLSGNLWWANPDYLQMICFDSSGKQINSLKKEENFGDFCFDEFGQVYFCNLEKGIFSFPNKTLYKFEELLKRNPRIFVFKNKMFVSVKKDAKFGIEILKLFY